MPLLARIGLGPECDNIINELKRVSILTVEELLERDAAELAKEANITTKAITKLQYQVSMLVLGFNEVSDLFGGGIETQKSSSESTTSPPFLSQASSYQSTNPQNGKSLSFLPTADSLHLEQEKIGYFTSGCNSLDNMLGGGIPPHSVLEVLGSSSIGKTQLAMTTTAEAAVAGSLVIFLDTSNAFMPARLQEIIKSRYGVDDQQVREALARIQVLRMSTLFEALDALSSLLEAPRSLFDKHQGRCLLVLDSLGAVTAPLGPGGRHAGAPPSGPPASSGGAPGRPLHPQRLPVLGRRVLLSGGPRAARAGGWGGGGGGGGGRGPGAAAARAAGVAGALVGLVRRAAAALPAAALVVNNCPSSTDYSSSNNNKHGSTVDSNYFADIRIQIQEPGQLFFRMNPVLANDDAKHRLIREAVLLIHPSKATLAREKSVGFEISPLGVHDPWRTANVPLHH